MPSGFVPTIGAFNALEYGDLPMSKSTLMRSGPGFNLHSRYLPAELGSLQNLPRAEQWTGCRRHVNSSYRAWLRMGSDYGELYNSKLREEFVNGRIFCQMKEHRALDQTGAPTTTLSRSTRRRAATSQCRTHGDQSIARHRNARSKGYSSFACPTAVKIYTPALR
jgi:hypothetical protein